MLIYIGIAVSALGFAINIGATNNLPLLGGGVIPQDDAVGIFMPIVITFIISVLLTMFFRLLK